MENCFIILYIAVFFRCTSGDTVGGNLSVKGFNSTDSSSEGFSFLATSPEYVFPFCGTVKRWRVLFVGDGTLWLQVWRPHKAMSYKLIQETAFYAMEASMMQQLTSITSPEVMHFVKGDVIGWKYKQNVNIPFRRGPVIARGRGFWKKWTSHSKGAITDWGQGEFLYGRQYAISAVISQNTPPFFVRDGVSVISHHVTIGDTTTIHSPVIAVSVKDRDDNRTLRVVMETKSVYFVFNDSSCNIYTAKWLKIGHFTLIIKAVDSCGKSASLPVFVTVVKSNPTTTQETFLGKPVIVWKVGLPLSLGLTLICLGSLFVCSCIRWRKETTFQDAPFQDAFTHEP